MEYINSCFNLHIFYLEFACIHTSIILQFTKSNYLLSYMTVEVILRAHFTKKMKMEFIMHIYTYMQVYTCISDHLLILYDKLSAWQSMLDSK